MASLGPLDALLGDVSAQCKQAALPALLSAQCLHLTALAPILSGSADTDVTPVLDGWIKQICGATPCSSDELQPLGTQLQPVCGDQHSPIVDALFSIKDHYGDFYDAVCAHKDDGQYCIIEVLSNFAQKTGKTANLAFAGQILNDMNGFMSTAATALADGSMCTPCLGTVFYEGKKFIPLIQNDNTLGNALAGLCEKPENKPYGGQVGQGITVPSGEKPKNDGSAPAPSDSASASASASAAPTEGSDSASASASGGPAPSGDSASASGGPAPTGSASASGGPKPSGGAVVPVPSGGGSKPSNAGPGPASAAHTGPVTPLSKASEAAPSSSAKAAAGAGADSDHAKSSAGKVTLKGAVAAAALVGSFVAFL